MSRTRDLIYTPEGDQTGHGPRVPSSRRMDDSRPTARDVRWLWASVLAQVAAARRTADGDFWTDREVAQEAAGLADEAVRLYAVRFGLPEGMESVFFTVAASGERAPDPDGADAALGPRDK